LEGRGLPIVRINVNLFFFWGGGGSIQAWLFLKRGGGIRNWHQFIGI
jgi:hypothetical protein